VPAGVLLSAVRDWLAQDPDSDTQLELAELLERAEAGSEEAIGDLRARFSGRLTFGTAGLRGELGAGPLRMNRVVVSHAANGLASYLLREASSGQVPSVVVGGDARFKSDTFVRDSAEILAARGVRVFVFDRPIPTPVLAFAVRHLGVSAGVMVTASHNPPGDNGYKVYLGDEDGGSQIIPPADREIEEAIALSYDAKRANELPRSPEQPTVVGDDLIEAYREATLRVASAFDLSEPPRLRLCYTPLHGVGGAVFLDLLESVGWQSVTVVPQQATPDPRFPTVEFPNPEEPGALDLAYQHASANRCDLIVAHDPDADRLAVALPDKTSASGWRMLTGNELGIVLLDELARHTRESGGSGCLARSLVSTPMLDQVAAHYGLSTVATPTGFKWISRAPHLLGGFEEALGYLINPNTVRDKDGLSAGLFVVLLAASLDADGLTLGDRLAAIRRDLGGFSSRQVTIRTVSADIPLSLVTSLRNNHHLLTEPLGLPLITDYVEGGAHFPAANILEYSGSGGDRVIIRPSGTEPKLKVYIDVLRPDQTEADRVADTLASKVSTLIDHLADALPASPGG
jgi:phosphomannomutase